MAVVRFPPLPSIPEPLLLEPDDRQATFALIADGLTGALSSAGSFATANASRGFRASAVDLGMLQDALAAGIATFDMAQVRERWDEDLFGWMRRLILTWVQRCKEISFDLAENGVRITMVTQDDRGYYRYEFDVFPGNS